MATSYLTGRLYRLHSLVLQRSEAYEIPPTLQQERSGSERSYQITIVFNSPTTKSDPCPRVKRPPHENCSVGAKAWVATTTLTSQGSIRFLQFSCHGRTFSGTGYKTQSRWYDEIVPKASRHLRCSGIAFSSLGSSMTFQRTQLATWDGHTGGVQSRTDPKVYVVQTATEAVQRCILMTPTLATWCSTRPAAPGRRPTLRSNGGGAGSRLIRRGWRWPWRGRASWGRVTLLPAGRQPGGAGQGSGTHWQSAIGSRHFRQNPAGLRLRARASHYPAGHCQQHRD